MASPKERAVLIDEFRKNTGTERHEAEAILLRNSWNLNNSYREIEQLCKANKPLATNNQTQGGSQPRSSGAIDVGLGPAIHLDKPASNSPQHANNRPVGKPLSALQARNGNGNFPAAGKGSQPNFVAANAGQISPALARPLASNSVNTKGNNSYGRIIPIQVLDAKGQLVATQGPLEGRSAGKPVVQQADALRDARSTLEEPVRPSQPSAVAPLRKDVDEDNEADDVFDDKFVPRRPMNTYPRLKRGFSNIIENEGIVSEAINNVQSDIRTESHDNMYVQTFVLPNLTAYSGSYRAFLEKELIETSTLVSLEQAGRLNWWAEMQVCQRLMPMATTGDGNCLLHAASLAMWGIHDRQLILRKELHETLTKAPYKDALYRRWRYQQTLVNKESGLVFNESEWKEEWANVLRLASAQPRGTPDPTNARSCCDSPVTQGGEEPVVYESLEEFHVFVLAHVLQRPIIIVADTFLKSSSGEALAPIPFAGIYLPLEVHPCYRSPLLLTYDAAHFSALAPMEQDAQASIGLPAAIPLLDPELKLLPIHFHVDPGSHVDWAKDKLIELTTDDKINLLQMLLDVEKIPFKLIESNGDSDLGSCGSQDSDESGMVIKEKDKKKEERKKHGQTSSNALGSFGKTVGKKLKQLGKSSKGDKQARRPSLRNIVTQSTAITPLEQYSTRDFVLVARLSEKRGRQQQEMIRNYLQDAHARFKRDLELKRRSDVELRNRLAPQPAPSNSNSAASCKSPGCFMLANQEHNFYCPKCFALKQEEMNKFQHSGGQFVYNTFPGRTRQAPTMTTQGLVPEEVFKCGNSKFYRSSDENIEQIPAASSSQNLMVSNLDKGSSRSSGNINLNRGRSPSPDYDNVEYTKPAFLTQHQRLGGRDGGVEKNVSQQTSSQRQMKCKTANCEFYGNPASDFLCSKCYQKQYQACLKMVNANANTNSTHL